MESRNDGLVADVSAIGATLLILVLAFAFARLSQVGTVRGVDGGLVDGGAESDAAAVPQPGGPVDAGPVDAGGKAARQPRGPMNVILITVDTLRADLGYSGYPRPVTPNIDALAARSIVYDNAYALASFTPKCLGPLLIGRYSSETARDSEHYTLFHPSNVFLAERVVAGGGHTVGAATHRYFGWKKGFDQGFDVWDTSAIPPNSVDNDPTITSGTLTDLAISLLSSPNAAAIPVRTRGPDAARSGPAAKHFFAWFHYLDPHLPYVPHEGAPAFHSMPGPGIPKERAAYDAEVWFTDKQVGRLLNHITAQPWASETAIIFTSDHGEAFGERGHWGHGRELWQPLVHVPLLVFIPGVQHRPVHVKRSHLDLVPTVLELMGLPADADLRGKSLVQDVSGRPLEERDVYIDMPEGPFNEMRRAIISGPSPGMKLIDFGGGRYELFDLRADPNEAKSLARDAEALGPVKEALTRARSGLREVAPSK